MKLNKFTVSFEGQDMYFLKKYGFFKAARMVKKHYKKHSTPFINDTYQLANELRIFRKDVFELSKNTRKHYKLIMLRKKNGGLRNKPGSGHHCPQCSAVCHRSLGNHRLGFRHSHQ